MFHRVGLIHVLMNTYCVQDTNPSKPPESDRPWPGRMWTLNIKPSGISIDAELGPFGTLE